MAWIISISLHINFFFVLLLYSLLIDCSSSSSSPNTVSKSEERIGLLQLKSEEAPRRPSICNLPSLQYLDLSNNQLEGPIPDCFGKSLRGLSVLNLQNNNFSGTIPEEIGSMEMLENLDLSNNGLHGIVPKSLANCAQLEVLNLGQNMLVDAYPSWLEDLPSLKVLVLRENKFHGTMPVPMANSPKSKSNSSRFANLHIIDVSHNELTGTLPSKYFEHWDSMMVADEDSVKAKDLGSDQYYQFSLTIMNKGLSLHYEKILITLKAIDFSYNKFHGTIPSTIGTLKGVKVLNLSGNALTGQIPSFLGNFTKLESLDLSRNKLSGKIPQVLSRLTFLEFLDLSHNNLTGVIPRGGQLDTFPSTSYEGNAGLCGFQLSKPCWNPDAPNSPSQKSHHHSKFDLHRFGWEVVLMGYLGGVGFGFVLGFCILRTKEEWLIRTFGLKMHPRGKRSSRSRS